MNLGAEGAYESDVPFAPVAGQDDYVSRLTGRFARVFVLRRTSLEIGADGGAALYRTITGLNRFTWGGDLTGSHEFSRRTALRLQARSAQAFARDDPRLTATGALPPLVMARSDTGILALSWQIAPRWTWRISGRGESFRFDSLVLRNGWTAGGRTGLERVFGRGMTLGGATEYERTATSERTIETEGLFATGRFSFLRGPELRLEAGAAYYRTIGLDDGQVTPSGLASLAWRFGPHTFTALASRRVQQTYGLGAIGILTAYSLGYSVPLGRNAKFTATATDADNDSPEDRFASHGQSLSAGIDVVLPGGVAARVSYAYWNRKDPTLDWNSHTVALALSRQFAWR